MLTWWLIETPFAGRSSDFWSNIWGQPISSDELGIEEDTGRSGTEFALSITGNGAYYVSKRGDIDRSGVVEFRDFSLLAEQRRASCNSNTRCAGRDLPQEGNIGFDDLAILCNHWLATSLK